MRNSSEEPIIMLSNTLNLGDRIVIKTLSKTIIALLCIFMCSCATVYKPNYYNAQSRVFHNYKRNYSAKIPDKYILLEPQDLDSLSKEFFSDLSEKADAFMTLKQYPVILTFYTNQQKTISEPMKNYIDQAFKGGNNIANLMSSLAKKNIFKEAVIEEIKSRVKDPGYELSSFRIFTLEEFLVATFIIKTQLIDVSVNLAFTYLAPDQNNGEYHTLEAVSLAFQTSNDIAYHELIAFLQGVEIGNLGGKERYASYEAN